MWENYAGICPILIPEHRAFRGRIARGIMKNHVNGTISRDFIPLEKRLNVEKWLKMGFFHRNKEQKWTKKKPEKG